MSAPAGGGGGGGGGVTPTSGGPTAGHLPGLIGSYRAPRPSGNKQGGKQGGRKPPVKKRPAGKPSKPTAGKKGN